MLNSVWELLKRACERYADKTAISDAQTSLTYSELLDAACRVASAVHNALDGARGQAVPVLIGRNALSTAAFFGVAASGNFYVPMDPSLPDKRLSDMLAVTGARLCVNAGQAVPASFAGLTVLDADLLPPADMTAVDGMASAILDVDPLYCIFTSGSTGTPKGVLVSHRSVLQMTRQFSEAFGFDDTTVFGNQAPFDFDVSVKDIYNTLYHGGSMHILDKKLFLTPKKLIETLDERRVNTLIWAASAMKILTSLKTFESVLPHHLRQVMFSGEALPAKVLTDWQNHLPGVRFVNLYGPTEITCNCTYYIIDRSFSPEEHIPIGRPFSNTGILLLRAGKPVKPGEIGEICVRGTCLALGYLNAPELTERAFCQNPLVATHPERIYRTGDLGRMEADGNLRFIGRADTQIKHMGHRIELPEIELSCGALPWVDACCCLYDGVRERIVLFYQSKTRDDKALIDCMKAALPSYMLPNRYIWLEKIPETRTGKLDRVLLREQYIL
ncbi:MAG: amino acid adenylation domain-containing protein [Clostridia bacterium]|nr:amino acid adenylation domain-containing protein [Clostridia bacterium]